MPNDLNTLPLRLRALALKFLLNHEEKKLNAKAQGHKGEEGMAPKTETEGRKGGDA